MIRRRSSRSTNTGMPRMRLPMCSWGGATAIMRSKYGFGRMCGKMSILMARTLPRVSGTSLAKCPDRNSIRSSEGEFSMLRSTKALVGFTISASDGDLGRVETLYFDDQHWTVRYFVVDTGGWLAEQSVLISPVCVRRPEWERGRLPVALTTAEVKESPSVDTHRPISRQYEIAFSEHYGIPRYWPGAVGALPYPLAPPRVSGAIANELQAHVEQQEIEDQHLRSTEDVRGCRLRTTDGDLGHVEDFLVEDLTWRIRYLDVD